MIVITKVTEEAKAGDSEEAMTEVEEEEMIEEEEEEEDSRMSLKLVWLHLDSKFLFK